MAGNYMSRREKRLRVLANIEFPIFSSRIIRLHVLAFEQYLYKMRSIKSANERAFG